MDADTSPFGRALRRWRDLRGMSQLDLATTAATTTRHLSYLETGRSRPGREMVDRLGEALGVSLRDRNQLFRLAGLAAAYPEGDLQADDMAPFRHAIDRMLATHEPYPAYVLDRGWGVVACNPAAATFLPGLDASVSERLALWSTLVDNLDEVAPAFLERVRQDLLRHPDDAGLRDLHEMMAELAGSRPPPGPSSARVLCPTFRLDGQLVRTITVVAQFEAAADITLDELRVELIYPRDEDAEQFFHARDAAAGPRSPGVERLDEPSDVAGVRVEVDGRTQDG